VKVKQIYQHFVYYTMHTCGFVVTSEKCVIFADDDNVRLVSMEASSGKKGASSSLVADENTGSPAVVTSHGSNDTTTAAEQQSLRRCSCEALTSSASPTHSLLNSAVDMVASSSAQGEMIYKHSASTAIDRRHS